ncbi:MAG: putative Se/S carrier-like protein [Bilophila sp.]
MSTFSSRLAGVLLRGSPPGLPPPAAPPPSGPAGERGFLVFQHTGEVIRAERILREAGFAVEVKEPPPELHRAAIW